MRTPRGRIIAAGLVLAVSVVCGCGGRGGVAGPVGSGSPAPEAVGSSSAGASGGPVPHGFIARDLTFVNPRTGWLLGTAPCSSPPCTSLVRTTDGGRTWVGVPAPRADLEPRGQSGCADRPCVRGIRFANASVGYAYGSTALYLTTDGGVTWARQPGQADAIEVAGGTALRVSHDTAGCPPGCVYQISTAPLATASWRPVAVPGPTLTGNAVQLLRTGHRAFLETYRNPAGGAGNAQATLLTSSDDGQRWTVRPDPCGTEAGQEADSQQLAVADDGSVTVLCRVRANGPDFVVTSRDGGNSFGPHHRTPGGANVNAVGAASASTLLVATTNGSTATLFRSTDAGASWDPVATAPDAARDGDGVAVLGFQNAQTGRWVPGSAAVLTSTDAGRTWVTYTFAS